MILQNLDWGLLPFGYTKTNYNVRCVWKNGKWGELEVSSSEYLTLHIGSTVLHYGQEAFEGLKAFRGKDERIRLFRWEENAKRMQNSCKRILMPEVPTELFRDAVIKAIKLNEDFVPPYGSGASLYIRPFIFGSGAGLGVKPSTEYTFIVFVSPVGPYFKTGFMPVDMLLVRSYDRAAPLGTGHIKAGGNYAAGLIATELAHSLGFANAIFLDAKEKAYIDECGPANFFGIKNNTYVTPESSSILPSITNDSLFILAQKLGYKAERRKVHISELADFSETGACGTAAVITPIRRIYDYENKQEWTYTQDQPGPICTELYNYLTKLQCGDVNDEWNWNTFVD